MHGAASGISLGQSFPDEGLGNFGGYGESALYACARECFREQSKNQLAVPTLQREKSAITVTALVDSGNSLTEPISGKPVCVVEEKIVRGLWGKSMKGFRAIPFHSVGQNHGILEGYLLPGTAFGNERCPQGVKGCLYCCQQRGIASLSGDRRLIHKMIVNPCCFQKTAGKSRKNGRM